MQTDFQNEAKDFTNPEAMASAYLARYYGQKKIEYPINPFQMLKDEDMSMHCHWLTSVIIMTSFMTLCSDRY